MSSPSLMKVKTDKYSLFRIRFNVSLFWYKARKIGSLPKRFLNGKIFGRRVWTGEEGEVGPDVQTSIFCLLTRLLVCGERLNSTHQSTLLYNNKTLSLSGAHGKERTITNVNKENWRISHK